MSVVLAYSAPHRSVMAIQSAVIRARVTFGGLFKFILISLCSVVVVVVGRDSSECVLYRRTFRKFEYRCLPGDGKLTHGFDIKRRGERIIIGGIFGLPQAIRGPTSVQSVTPATR